MTPDLDRSATKRSLKIVSQRLPDERLRSAEVAEEIGKIGEVGVAVVTNGQGLGNRSLTLGAGTQRGGRRLRHRDEIASFQDPHHSRVG